MKAHLQVRSDNKCELCQSEGPLKVYEVPPATRNYRDNEILICDKCLAQIEKKAELDPGHWTCLADAMWSEVPGVKVVTWRMLNRLKKDSWAQDNLDMMFLDEDIQAWAEATGDHDNDGTVELHKDADGNVLQSGDTVILTKALDVKGTSINAKLGTVVKNIRLVPDNTEQIEGRMDGQTIVILTRFLRKHNN
jgi:protein PhnA